MIEPAGDLRFLFLAQNLQDAIVANLFDQIARAATQKICDPNKNVVRNFLAFRNLGNRPGGYAELGSQGGLGQPDFFKPMVCKNTYSPHNIFTYYTALEAKSKDKEDKK